MRLLVAVLLMLVCHAAAQMLPSAPVWLTSTPGGVHALTADGRVFVTDGAAFREVAAGLSADAPLTACGDRVLGVSREGELVTVTPGGPAASSGAGLSTSAGLACDGAAVIAVGAQGAAVRLEGAGEAWRVVARASVNALPDARPTVVRVAGQPAVALLAGPTRRYAHGALGDDLEAGSLILLDARSLRETSRLDLPAPFVFEDVTARLTTLPDRSIVLVVVQAGPDGARLVTVGFDGGRVRIVSRGPELGAGRRWLDPVVGQRELYAVHTPHVGGVLHRYDARGAELRPSELYAGVASHRFGSRTVGSGLVLAPGQLILPAQDQRSLLQLQCAPVCRVTGRHALSAPLSSNVLHHQGAVVAGDASGRLHHFR